MSKKYFSKIGKFIIKNWDKAITIILAIVSLSIALGSCLQSSKAIKISSDALEYTKKTQRPHLVLGIERSDRGDCILIKRDSNGIEFESRIKCKNNGSITADNVREQFIIKCIFNGKEYNSLPSGGSRRYVSLYSKGVSLSPGGGLFFSSKIVIKDFSQKQTDAIIEDYVLKKLPITAELNVEYSDSSTLKKYSISAVYNIIKNDAEIIKYDDK